MSFRLRYASTSLMLLAALTATACRQKTIPPQKGAETLRIERFGDHGPFLHKAEWIELYSLESPPSSDLISSSFSAPILTPGSPANRNAQQKRRAAMKDERFHGYRVLGSHDVYEPADILAVWKDLNDRINTNPAKMEVACFLPRHGIRAFYGKESRDYLICFECQKIRVYNSLQEKDCIGYIPLQSSTAPMVINRILDDADIAREKPSSEGK